VKLAKKTDKEINDILIQSFYGLIRISSAINYICKYMFATLEKENHQKFKEECKNHFEKDVAYHYLDIFSPDTRLRKDFKFDEVGYSTIPTDWENHFITLADYNRELETLNVDKIVPRILSHEEAKKLRESNPYKFSELRAWLKLDTWKQNDGLLLITGIEPQGADVNWEGYKNYMGVHIEGTQLINACLLDDAEDYYDLPHNMGEDEAKNKWNYGEDLIEELAERNKTIQKYSKILNDIKIIWDASNFKDERYSPKHYIEWAVSKNIDLPWLDWAIENKLTEQVINSDIEELGDNEKKNLLLTIGALTDMYANEKGTAFKSGDKPNISRVTEKLLKHLNSDIYGLGKSALNKRISDGIKLLQKAKKDS